MGRKSNPISGICVYSRNKKQVVTPGWKGPNVANLTLGLKEWCHIGSSVLLSIAGSWGMQQQQKLN